MDCPPGAGLRVEPFAALGGWLRSRGFSAPETLAAAPEPGLLLLEDLGDALYARLCEARPEAELPLYEAAVDLLCALHEAPPPETVEGVGCVHRPPPFDLDHMLREARLAREWWAPAAGAPLSAEAAAEYDAHVVEACAELARDRRALALLDYHAENLIWAPQRTGVARVGLLDYQDARIGAPEYDLVSLLEDARRDLGPGLAARMRARYRDARGLEPERFDARCAALAAQRNLKIVGIFARLCARDGKPRYLDLVPRVWEHLMRDLDHPALAALAGFVRARLPAPTPEALARARSWRP